MAWFGKQESASVSKLQENQNVHNLRLVVLRYPSDWALGILADVNRFLLWRQLFRNFLRVRASHQQ